MHARTNLFDRNHPHGGEDRKEKRKSYAYEVVWCRFFFVLLTFTRFDGWIAKNFRVYEYQNADYPANDSKYLSKWELLVQQEVTHDHRYKYCATK